MDGCQEPDLRLTAIATRRLLTLQYAARLPPRHNGFQWPTSAALLIVQNDLYKDVMAIDGDAANECESYRKIFLKELIRRLEDGVAQGGHADDLEVNGALLEEYARLMACAVGARGQPAPRIVTHFFPSPLQTGLARTAAATPYGNALLPGWQPIRMAEAGANIAHGTTGLVTWEASLRLAGHLTAQPSILTDTQGTVIELGCGAGFLGLLISLLDRALQRRLLLTDLDGRVLEKTKQNIALNCGAFDEGRVDMATAVRVAPLDWLDVQHGDKDACRRIDELDAHLVLAADVVFDPALVTPLCAVLKRLLMPKNAHRPAALIASTMRNPDTYILFLVTLTRMGLRVEETQLDTPVVDLRTLMLTTEHQRDECIRLFPSFHEDGRDGTVKLLRITDPSQR